MSISNNSLVKDFDVIIVGGGLAGLTSAILLSRNKKKVLLIEKKSYPFHKVCGEYVSNEVLPFLKSLGFDPFKHGAVELKQLRVSSPSGKQYFIEHDIGGFGLSRYRMDWEMFKVAQSVGAQVRTNTKVTDIIFGDNNFKVETNQGETFSSKLVIGSYGKRDLLDKKLNRDFIKNHTGYLGVKYHVRLSYPMDAGLDNFEGGYCGISRIEDNKYNLCYLYKRNPKKDYKTIHELEENVLFRNPVIKNIFENSEFLFDEPEVINEISFAPKKIIENHILMCGDSAGLITPVCGNGMSMAINGARLLCELILESEILKSGNITIQARKNLEEDYETKWKKYFQRRLFWGRAIQSVFGSRDLTSLGLKIIHSIPLLKKWLIANTHGKAHSIDEIS